MIAIVAGDLKVAIGGIGHDLVQASREFMERLLEVRGTLEQIEAAFDKEVRAVSQYHLETRAAIADHVKAVQEATHTLTALQNALGKLREAQPGDQLRQLHRGIIVPGARGACDGRGGPSARG